LTDSVTPDTTPSRRDRAKLRESVDWQELAMALVAEVEEWVCENCKVIYPGPPQEGVWCVRCPRCQGNTMPRGVAERRKLEKENESLKAKLERLMN